MRGTNLRLLLAFVGMVVIWSTVPLALKWSLDGASYNIRRDVARRDRGLVHTAVGGDLPNSVATGAGST